jgi:hypothetical protein
VPRHLSTRCQLWQAREQTDVRLPAGAPVNVLLAASKLEGRDEVLTRGPNNRRSLGREVSPRRVAVRAAHPEGR